MWCYRQLLSAADRLTDLAWVYVSDKLGGQVDGLFAFTATALGVGLDTRSINVVAKLSWLAHYRINCEIEQVSLWVSVIFEEIVLMAQAESSIANVAEVAVWN